MAEKTSWYTFADLDSADQTVDDSADFNRQVLGANKISRAASGVAENSRGNQPAEKLRREASRRLKQMGNLV